MEGYCGSLVENADHTLFVCARWGVERETVGRAVGAQLTPDTIVPPMLQSKQIWMLIESFVTLVMQTREIDGRAERDDNGFQLKSHRSLHPRSCVLGGLGCPRRPGEESSFSSPCWRGQSTSLTGVFPWMGDLGERITKESYVTLSWNQLPGKFKDERRFRGQCIGSREGFFFCFNRYVQSRPQRILYSVYKRFRYFSF